jgi:hypothetical protein
MLIGQPGRDAPSRRSVEKADLDEKRFINFLEGVLFFG